MKEILNTDNGKLSFEKASELGKTLSRGGITLADNVTAFTKKYAFR
tara:strand:+ start:4594 stop:4731 length:138 start_codon:yes stop_codon:yes gene_type:complete